jgi:hypothetical protein
MSEKKIAELYLIRMKKFTAYLFFTLYLFSFSEACFAMKLAEKNEPLKEQQKLHKDKSLLAIDGIHYMQANSGNRDLEGKAPLPFVKINHHLSLSSAHLKTVANTGLAIILPYQPSIFIIVNDQWIPSRFLSTIFQPPKA